MWCPHCQADTTPAEAEPSAELRCSQCGNPVSSRPASADSVRQARDILARWSTSNLLDEISALPAIPPIPESDGTVSGPSAGPVAPAPRMTEPAGQPQPQSGTDAAASSEQDEAADDHISLPNAPISTESTSQTDAHPAPQNPVPDSDAAVTPAPLPESSTVSESTNERGVEPAVDESQPFEVTTKLPKTSTRPEISTPRFLSRETQKDATEESSAGTSQSGKATTEDNTALMSAAGKTPRRAHQPRAVQPREKRQRDGRQETSLQKKETSSVTRKFRIDDPGGASHSFESPTPAQQSQPAANSDAAAPRSNSSPDGRRIRIDSGQTQGEVLSTADSRTRTQSPARQRYIDEPHESAMRGPHFEVTRQPRSNLTAMTGQFLAYLGVLGLTIGTALVIYGHFGGYSEYTPTGWLVTTVAQMMLFLGVINLVSGGIEKNNDDVSARINHLGEQLMRIEHVTEEVLRGPRIPAHRYADPDAISESERETVAAGEQEA